MSQDLDRLISTGSSPGLFGRRVLRLAEACRRCLLLCACNARSFLPRAFFYSMGKLPYNPLRGFLHKSNILTLTAMSSNEDKNLRPDEHLHNDLEP
jgi:hypothetical protein